MEYTYNNRELSWLSFNERVLQEAQDRSVPLLSRLQFLGIVSNNQDEFFKVRIANLIRLNRTGRQGSRQLLGGYTPADLLAEVSRQAERAQARFAETYRGLLREMEAEGIFVVDETGLTPHQQEFCRTYFASVVSPRLVPLMLRKSVRIPFLPDGNAYLGVRMGCTGGTSVRYAVIQVPVSSACPRFVVLPSEPGRRDVIFLDDIIRLMIDEVFFMFSYDTISAHTFKIMRDAELTIDDDVSKSLFERIAEGVESRRYGSPIRLIYDRDMPADLLDMLARKLKLSNPGMLAPGDRYHLMKDLMKFPDVRPDLRTVNPAPLRHRDIIPFQSILKVVRRRDILLNYPYHSFQHFIDFLREAAIDPHVERISITLYRTAEHSKVINALVNAARNGKQVSVFVELKARFDEEQNIEHTDLLQREGVKVIYAIEDLKVHCKTVLVERREILRTARIRLHRDGQFQREYGGDLRRLRSADRPQGDRRRCPQRVPVPHEQPQAVQVQAPARIALLHARGVRRTDRPRDAQRPQGTQGLYLRQMQLTDRRTDHRPPLPGQPGRRRGTADRPWSLLPAPLGRGHERADPGHQHRGQVPRARPALHLLQRRRRTDLHRVGRLDVAQPRPPGRGLHTDPRPADPAPPAQGLRHPVVGQREGTRPCGPGGQSPPETRSGAVPRTQPDGAVRLLQGTKRKGEKRKGEMNRETFGAIDIGSNAIRLLIDYVEAYEDGRTEYKKAAFVRVPIRLGDDVFLRGRISNGKAEALCDAMQGFSALFRAFAVKDYRAYATSAMREAENGSEVVSLIRNRSGISVEIISGEAEAGTIFAAGGLRETLDPAKTYLYVDVGGGSTEIVVYARRRKVDACSFRLGTVRIFSRAEEPAEWERFGRWLEQIDEKWHPSGIIGSGGNINKVHKMLEKKSRECIRAKELTSLYARLRDMSVEERMEQLYLNQSRAEVIVPALKIFTEVLRICRIDTVCVPRMGLADGIIHQLYRQYNPFA